jgi:hypothetical protein
MTPPVLASGRALAAGRIAAVALLVVAGLVAPPAVAAADPTFGDARASATFGEAIDVEQPLTLPEAAVRAEAVVRTVGTDRTFLATIPVPDVGSSTLRYRHETPFGALYPNTRVELGFRLTFEDGRVIDSPTATIRYEDTRFAWQTLEGPLVRVHWVQGSDAFGRRALEVGERAVEEATQLLGVAETEPIDFFVYGDRDAFYDILGPAQRENVGGIALPEIRTLFANIPPSGRPPGTRTTSRRTGSTKVSPTTSPRATVAARAQTSRARRDPASSCRCARWSPAFRRRPRSSASRTTRACPRSTT